MAFAGFVEPQAESQLAGEESVLKKVNKLLEDATQQHKEPVAALLGHCV